MMAFDGFYPMIPSISAVSIHHKSNLPCDGTLSERADQQLSKLIERPFCRRRSQQPLSKPRCHILSSLAGEDGTGLGYSLGDVAERFSDIALDSWLFA